MTPEELAQALADHFHPPRTDYQRKNLPLKALKERFPDREDWYEAVEVRATPDWQPYKTFTAADGYPSSRALTYRELAEAALAILTQGTAAQ